MCGAKNAGDANDRAPLVSACKHSALHRRRLPCLSRVAAAIGSVYFPRARAYRVADMGTGMTEDEAKTKWCPFAITDMYARTKRLEDHAAWPIAGFATCLASACMAWRDNRKPAHDIAYWKEASVGMFGADLSKGEEYAAREHARCLRENPIQGYCGLAGVQE